MKDALEAIFAIIGAFVLIYAVMHDGKMPHMFPRATLAKQEQQ